MTSNKKTLLAEADTSAKRNLISVGGFADTPVDLVEAGNVMESAHVLATGRLC